MVTIRERFLPIGDNRPGQRFGSSLPNGLVQHSTACPSATDDDIDAYFLHNPQVQASAHIVVDWADAVKIIPLSEIAWHAGQTANHQFLGIELCETPEKEKFESSIQNLLDVLEEIFKAYGWPVDYDERIAGGKHFYSHNQTSLLWRETTHTDPTGYLASHGYNMTLLSAALEERLKA